MHYYYDPDTDTIKTLGTPVVSSSELDALYLAIKTRWDREQKVWQHTSSEQKYTVQVFEGDPNGYLNYDSENYDHLLSDGDNASGYQAHFTQAEINALKQRDDIAIDWDKAIIKRVDDD